MGKKSKVLMFLQYGVGGAERMTLLIGKLLKKEKYEITFVLVKKRTKSTPIDAFVPDGYRVMIVDGSTTFKAISQIYTLIKGEKPDICFSSVLFINNKLLPLHFLFPKMRFVIRCENYLYTFKNKQKLAIKYLYPFADAIIAQTQEMKDELVAELKFNKGKIHVLQNPIDKQLIEQCILSGSNPYPNDNKIHYVASGRFAYQKGFDLLVDAFNIVAQKRDDVDLYIIGNKEGICYDEYKKVYQKVLDYGLENRVHCEGFQTNPYVYVKYADTFVLSSRWEGLPNVLIEALHLGTPVAAYKCIPIIERIVNEGIDGFLAEKENVESLAQAMIQSCKLGKIVSSYKPSEIDDFERIFN